MQKETLKKALKELREKNKKRNFLQSAELIINFKDLDLKKPEANIRLEVTIPNAIGEAKSKAVVFVRDKNFAAQLKELENVKIIPEAEIENLSKKDVEKLIAEYPVFFAEGPVMLTVGKYLGQQLAPRGRMPKPITTDINQLKKLLAKASSSIIITNKKGKPLPYIHLKIGNENFDDEMLIDNILAIYSALKAALPRKEHNIKSVYIKFTMSKAVKVV